jgi:hypothetical protein
MRLNAEAKYGIYRKMVLKIWVKIIGVNSYPFKSNTTNKVDKTEIVLHLLLKKKSQRLNFRRDLIKRYIFKNIPLYGTFLNKCKLMAYNVYISTAYYL